MKRNMHSLARTGRDGEKGQALYLVAGLLFFFLAAVAFVVDFGHVVHAQRELQASADAAATAGGVDLPNGALATTDATNYSAVTGNLNADPNGLPNVTMVSGYPKLLCLNTLSTDENMPCTGTSPNAIQVKEQATVPLYFAKVFGWSSVTLTATATSSARGGVPHPLYVIIIMDTTASMQTRDPNCTVAGIGSPSQEDCAKAGVRTLLAQMWPCAPNLSNCGAADASGNVANPVDRVGMMVFPGLSSSTYDSWEYTGCQANKLTASATGPIVPYSPTTDYLIIAPASDYRTSDTAAGLNASSNLVKTVDFADEGCTPTGSNTIGGYGLQDPGGEGTYYAGAISQAQATFPTTGPAATIQKVIILLSDGAANATGSEIAGGLAATNECAAGVAAAQAAAQNGTWVYTIAYNSSNSSGLCTTDNSGGVTNPCTAMKSMANSPGNYPDPNKFYADGNSALNGCVSSVHPSITSLQQIFQTIGEDLLTTQLIPNNTT